MASIVDSQNSASPTSFLKHIVDSANLKVVPSNFKYINDPSALSSDSIPVIDFSALTATDPDLRSKAIHDLAKACEEWSFFILVNHGIPEDLMNATFAAIREFVSLPEDEKKQYVGKSASDPINCGSFSNTKSNRAFTFWRENLKLHVHPELHCPDKPHFLREVVREYSERTRKLTRELLGAVSEGLELEQGYADEVLELDSSFQIFAANYYPPCPQPDQAIGIPPHTDHGLLTLLIHSGVPGLQIDHDGQWINVDSPKNVILVNVADQLESFSNGRYKSLKHRAVVNEERERMSIVSGYGPSKTAIFGPAARLVEKDGGTKYRSMKYEEYVELVLTKSRGTGKSPLYFPDDDQTVN